MLRYFSSIGSQASGEIGENPPGKPRNLLPSMVQIADARLITLNIFGNDYETPDGTEIRGCIHVMELDLVSVHVAAMEEFMSSEFNGWKGI